MVLRRLLFVFSVALAMMCAADAAVADQLYIETSDYSIETGLDSAGRAGEFRVRDYSGPAYLTPATHLPAGSAPYVFHTFCLERFETVGPGSYYFTLDDAAYNGSVGPAGDPLDPTTARLFYAFWTGQLAGFDYGNVAGDRATNASDLQLAFWRLENEIDDADLALPGVDDGMAATYIAFANNPLTTWASLGVNGVGADSIGPVQVLNLWNERSTNPLTGEYVYSGQRQSQLFVGEIVPLPAGALMGFAMLGGLGLVSGVRRRRRRRNAA